MPESVLARDAAILAINVARIGDTLLVTPALAALKAAVPEGTLTCLAHPGRFSILAGLPCIDHLGAITKQRAFWRGRWGGKRYDVAVVYGRDRELVRYALRVSRKVVAFRQDDATINAQLFACVEPPHLPGHAVDHRFALLQPLGIQPATDSKRRLQFKVEPDERSAAQAWLKQRFPMAENMQPICLQTASFPTKPYRNWPEGHFHELAQRLLDDDPRRVLVLLGDSSDRARAERIAAGLGPRATVSAGALSLRQSAALLSLARLYVGVDTGITHIAGALGLPIVALYHCLHPGRFLMPLDHPAPLEVIEHPDLGGRCDESVGMDRISVDQVWQAVCRATGRA